MAQYTITGFDASRASERGDEGRRTQRGARHRDVRRLFRSSFGFILLVAVHIRRARTWRASTTSGRRRLRRRHTSWATSPRAARPVGRVHARHRAHRPALLRCRVGRDLGVAHVVRVLAVTAPSPVTGSWSQARARPHAGLRRRSRSAASAWALMLPTLSKGKAVGIPFAFYAIVSIAVIGLYLAFVFPINLRWRMGDRFEAGAWTLGKHYQLDRTRSRSSRWIASSASTCHDAVRFRPGIPGIGRGSTGQRLVNYAPLTVGGASSCSSAAGGCISAKRWFKGRRSARATRRELRAHRSAARRD